ncbi:SRPBCC family protein [Polynucleobacter asymbioticus]|uniref:Cyclase/dehydrase n=1 Tax=Polynucleobacter asymbioticus TaxID=576611 RepID=A0AAC9IZ07_9BURK|nr:SRPBCC family protein [Polynucleobacter asymbioticus]APB99927.1 cyclase/dehydrase [Polynucleobacter asymbioticus]APC02222.1 cyclase/dehydrase [Polynucleobacter asymbioticus]APC07017.1 cyclase/dehydrase [Polynucleobacter asymbioticus]
MKWMFTLVLTFFFFISQSFAQENSNPFDVQVGVTPNDGRFHVQASYSVPMNICSAYTFITDYEGSKNIPGIVEAKVISRVGNKVRVYRVIEEQILFFPIEMKSTVEYTELPNRSLTFEQISGDTRSYKGTWKLVEEKEKTLFKYDAQIEPNSIIPSAIIEYFIKNSMRGRFESMAQRASEYKPIQTVACK